jgi:multicomponent K+:H+ antiporter subunit G
MNALDALPGWAALLIAALVLASALLALIGSIGLLRLKDFYRRMHAPTLGTTLGMALMVIATVVFFSLVGEGVSLTAVLIGVFITATTPITMLLLTRAALERDRAEGAPDVPAESMQAPD